MAEQAAEYWRYEFKTLSGQTKTLRLLQGDLVKADRGYDVVVCSAFRNDYIPTASALIGKLLNYRGILVHALAKDPELDLRDMGCWLSRELEGDFRRIACVELLSYRDRHNERMNVSTILKGAFATLRFVLEQADLRSIPVRDVALPILGTGNQGIAVREIAGPLLNQCLRALEGIPGLRSITFYELRPEKLREMMEVLNALTRPEPAASAQVFISYSTRCTAQAARMRAALENRGLRCWMAPDSLGVGSDYSREIPVVLNQVQAVALLLTPEAEQSNWVHKEVGVAIGSGRKVIPYQPAAYELGSQFRFLLEGIQIFPGWSYPVDAGLALLADQVWQAVQGA